MSARVFFTGYSIYEFAALTKITVEDEGGSWFSVSGLVFVFGPNQLNFVDIIIKRSIEWKTKHREKKIDI